MTVIKHRICLKMSGEALMGSRSYGIDPSFLINLAKDISNVHSQGIEICIVIGGGNIFRGVASEDQNIDRVSGDYMGMLATVMNAIALQSALEKSGLTTRVLSAISMHSVCEPYIFRRASRHLERKRIIICAAGTGNPYFTTDSAAVLRAAELKCSCLYKATNVDGVYTSDPKLDKNAKHIPNLDYDRALSSNLKVMDGSAIALARDYKIPITVFSILKPNAFSQAFAKKGRLSYIENSG